MSIVEPNLVFLLAAGILLVLGGITRSRGGPSQ
jgi:hypothetical protein